MKQMKKEIKKRFLAGIKFVIIVGLLLLSLSYAGFFNWAKTLRRTNDTPTTIVAKTSTKKIDIANSIASEMQNRKEALQKKLSYREDGKEKIFYDVSYGGDEDSTNPEDILGTLEVPKVGINMSIFDGIGSTASSPNGDYNRLFNAVTVRAYQELGVSNFVIASHTYNVKGSVSHSKDWFTPLLTDESGVVTDKISDLKLKKGDEIFITENSTGWKYTFRVSKISFGEKGNSENIVYKDVNYDNLSAHIGEPMITLQGCSGENDLLFVRGALEKIEDPQSGETYKP